MKSKNKKMSLSGLLASSDPFFGPNAPPDNQSLDSIAEMVNFIEQNILENEIFISRTIISKNDYYKIKKLKLLRDKLIKLTNGVEKRFTISIEMNSTLISGYDYTIVITGSNAYTPTIVFDIVTNLLKQENIKYRDKIAGNNYFIDFNI